MRWLVLPLLVAACSGADDTPVDDDGDSPTGDSGFSFPTTQPPDPCDELTGPVAVAGDLNENTEWTCTNVPYVLSGVVRVRSGARLTIGPGVEVQLDAGAHLEVGVASNGGSLVADGTAEPIVFTSSLSAPAQGAHGGILVGENAGQAILRNVTIEFGGAKVATPTGPVSANLAVASTAEITGSRFTDSAGYGVQFTERGRPSPFRDNTFARIGLQPVILPVDQVAALSGPNLIEPTQVIAVTSGTLARDATWADVGAPYLLDTVRVEGPDEPLLTLEAGTRLRFRTGGALAVGIDGPGGLSVEGTGAAPVTFGSAAADPKPGDWSGVVIDAEATTASFAFAEVSHAGALNLLGSRTGLGGLLVIDVGATVTDSTFRDHAGSGIAFLGTGGADGFDRNTFTGNVAPISVPAGQVASLEGTHTFDPGSAIEVGADRVETTQTWADVGAPYALVDDVYVGSSSEPVLTIGPGVELQLTSEVSLIVGRSDPGGLVMDGTAGRITVTSDRTEPAAGDWESVAFDTNTVQAVIRATDFRYCGEEVDILSIFPASACVVAIDTSPTITGSTFEDSAGYGIAFLGTATSANASGNTFTRMASGDVQE